MPKIASVYLPLPVDQFFYYRVEDDTPLFARVIVTIRNHKEQGVIGTLLDENEVNVPYEIYPVDKVIDEKPIFDQNTWELARWMSNFYVSPLGEVINTILPRAARPTTFFHEPPKPNSLYTLNTSQKEAYERIQSFIGQNKAFLLHGVTGSGKTEIYKHLVHKCLEMGKSALILLPEIALTPQMLSRFSQVFGDVIALYHSKLSSGERLSEWLRCFSGEARVAIGARSAIFLPLRNLGLIIIDEEHEPSYKSQENPRYHARQVAFQRSKTENALLVLGSATPLIETYYHAQKGTLELVKLPHRHGATSLPQVHIVDLKQSREKDKNFILSAPLSQAMLETLSRQEQVLLFLNRRGFAPTLFCKDCGYTFACPNCDITLTLHRKKNALICHHCGYQQTPPDICPQCKGFNIKEVGIGTEKLESFLEQNFPGYRTIRLDLDTTSHKHSFDIILKDIQTHKYDIIVGTQMMAKGHDIAKLSLVGIILADIGLQIPDFRASERTFVLITQVVGRAGRRNTPGIAYIQTYLPDHPAITFGAKQDYEGFYTYEIDKRKAFSYPPFVRLGRIVLRSSKQDLIRQFFATFEQDIATFAQNNKKTTKILGPLPCPLEKLKNNYRYHIIIKSQNVQVIQAFFRLMKEKFAAFNKRDIYLELDIDPLTLL